MNAKEALLKEAQGEEIEAILVERKGLFSDPLFFDKDHIEDGFKYVETWDNKRSGYPTLFAWTKSKVIFKYVDYEYGDEEYISVPRNPNPNSEVWSV